MLITVHILSTSHLRFTKLSSHVSSGIVVISIIYNWYSAVRRNNVPKKGQASKQALPCLTSVALTCEFNELMSVLSFHCSPYGHICAVCLCTDEQHYIYINNVCVRLISTLHIQCTAPSFTALKMYLVSPSRVFIKM